MKKNLYIGVLILNISLALINILFLIFLFLFNFKIDDIVNSIWITLNNSFMIIYIVLFISEFIYWIIIMKEKELERKVRKLLLLSFFGFFICIFFTQAKFPEGPILLNFFGL